VEFGSGILGISLSLFLIHRSYSSLITASFSFPLMTPYNKHTDHTITAIAERRLYATKKYTTKPPLSIMHRLVVALIAVMGVVAHSFQATSVVGPLQSRIPIKGGDDDIEPNNSNTSKRRTFINFFIARISIQSRSTCTSIPSTRA
jgi:hypothetical protein